jgi:hypothetical protein
MLSDARLDPVRVALAEGLVPGTFSDVQLARRVAFHVPRQLLELNPEQAFAGRRTGIVDGERLSHDDRCLGRQQASLRFVHCS